MIGEKNSGPKDKICTLGAAEGGEPHVESCRAVTRLTVPKGVGKQERSGE